jgi:hypothetical protein
MEEMSEMLEVLGAVLEVAEAVDSMRGGEKFNVFTEGAQAALPDHKVRQICKKHRDSTSSSILSINSTAPVTVLWSDPSLKSKVGLSSIPAKNLIKCHPSELFLTDDVVQATRALTYGSGKRVSTGSYGIMKGYDDQGNMNIHWLVDEIGELSGTSSIYLKKCDQGKFFKVGDVVRAVYDLRFGFDNAFVPKGSHGTLKELEDGGSWTVDWWNGIIDVSTKQEYLLKCDQRRFYKLGEVVKAKVDLKWSTGELVSAGTFGTLMTRDLKSNTWGVHWWDGKGISSGELLVYHAHLLKCQYTEYWLPDDVFKTNRAFNFGERGTVPKGSFCQQA